MVVGSRRALAMAVRNDRPGERNSMLGIRLRGRRQEEWRRFLKAAPSDSASCRPLKAWAGDATLDISRS